MCIRSMDVHVGDQDYACETTKVRISVWGVAQQTLVFVYQGKDAFKIVASVKNQLKGE